MIENKIINRFLFHPIALLFLFLLVGSCTKERDKEIIDLEEEQEEVVLVPNDTISGIAFPGAYGYGSLATGGRGGKVVAVTNLHDSGPGSFRQAFSEYPEEPITVVFQVGGTIELKSDVKVNRSNITVAGQTAPGDGICLSGASLIINGARSQSQGGNHGNIIIRYIRSRPGSYDSKGVYGLNIENCHTVIIDHCSFSWANEECVATYDTKNVTIQWSIVSEGLYNAGHQKGVRSYGGVWGGQYSSFHRNLIANNVSRTLAFNGARAHDTIARIDYENNVVYNWGGNLGCYGGRVEIENGISEINMLNNYYKPGPATPAGGLHFYRASHDENLTKGIGRLYLSGNYMVGHDQMNADNWEGINLNEIPESGRGKVKMAQGFAVESYALLPKQSAEDSYREVLNNAGANKPRRDKVDERVVAEVRNGTASGLGSHGKPGIIDSPEAAGGYPNYRGGNVLIDNDNDGIADYWERKFGLDPSNPSDGNGYSFSENYTNLEVYLNSLVL